MTLDVTIGKIVIENCENKAHTSVEECPRSENTVCDSNHTLWATESYRSGSSGFWEFWSVHCNCIYHALRDHPNTNDRDVGYLKPCIDDINNLSDECGSDANSDRMKWFKHWANKAVELYGDDAGIMFC